MQNYENGSKGSIQWNHQGNSYAEEVIYAGASKNKTGEGNVNEACVWITNRGGVTSPLPLSFAKEFFMKPGQKYKFATEEEVPFVPESKIFPHDPGKTPDAQIKATTTKTGKEVSEAVEEGEEVNNSSFTWNEVRALAKEHGVVAYKRSKADIEKELVDKNLI